MGHWVLLRNMSFRLFRLAAVSPRIENMELGSYHIPYFAVLLAALSGSVLVAVCDYRRRRRSENAIELQVRPEEKRPANENLEHRTAKPEIAVSRPNPALASEAACVGQLPGLPYTASITRAILPLAELLPMPPPNPMPLRARTDRLLTA